MSENPSEMLLDDEETAFLSSFDEVNNELLRSLTFENTPCDVLDGAVLDRIIGTKVKRNNMCTGASRMCDIDGDCLAMIGDTPPRYALESELEKLRGKLESKNNFMEITLQPPLEVRTRSKTENRTFQCNLAVAKAFHRASATVRLCYANEGDSNIDILGGTLVKPVCDGQVCFDDLSINVASPKHGEREFVLKISLDSHQKSKATNRLDDAVFSTPFYGYSHKSVLERRREVVLRAASVQRVCSTGGMNIHVVGSPFVKSDRLKCVIRARVCDVEDHISGAEVSQNEEWVSIAADGLEHFSETVIFFNFPCSFQGITKETMAFIQVTNDGRNFSNPIPVMIEPEFEYRDAKRHCVMMRSKM